MFQHSVFNVSRGRLAILLNALLKSPKEPILLKWISDETTCMESYVVLSGQGTRSNTPSCMGSAVISLPSVSTMFFMRVSSDSDLFWMIKPRAVDL